MEIQLLQCESGRWLAWPKDRPDITASGETQEDCIENLKAMYEAVIADESTSSTSPAT